MRDGYNTVIDFVGDPEVRIIMDSVLDVFSEVALYALALRDIGRRQCRFKTRARDWTLRACLGQVKGNKDQRHGRTKRGRGREGGES